MSVHIENNVPIECMQFIDSENIRTSLNEFERRKSDTNTLHDRKNRQTIEKNKIIQTKCSCLHKCSIFIQRIKSFCTWKIPWIAILISVVQVFQRKSDLKTWLQSFVLVILITQFPFRLSYFLLLAKIR